MSIYIGTKGIYDQWPGTNVSTRPIKQGWGSGGGGGDGDGRGGRQVGGSGHLGEVR